MKKKIGFLMIVATMLTMLFAGSQVMAGTGTLKDSEEWFVSISVALNQADDGGYFDCEWYVDENGNVERHEYTFDGKDAEDGGDWVTNERVSTYILQKDELDMLNKLVKLPKYGMKAKLRNDYYEVCWKPVKNGRIFVVQGNEKMTFGTDAIAKVLMGFDKTH